VNLADPSLKDFYMHSQSMEEITEKFGYTNADNAKESKVQMPEAAEESFLR
jgi:hypothetical protein